MGGKTYKTKGTIHGQFGNLKVEGVIAKGVDLFRMENRHTRQRGRLG